ncbi:MAG: ABC transporter permease [Liquorilactobacillus satsumensis]|uniref:ABC transporter permease n=1 Tax=Liquorilactobacillus TaxID=2767888 RepID=UPI0039ECE9B9
MVALTKRNLLLYFRNRSGVFFSLLGAVISFVLYIVFLKKSMVTSWQKVPYSQQLLDFWLIGGTLSVTAITTTLTSLGQLVQDKERKVIQDFYLTDLSRFEMKMSYMCSAALIGFFMQLVMLFSMLIYFSLADRLIIPWSSMPAIICLALFSSLLEVVMHMLLVQFINRVNSLGTLGTIIGTAAGFLVGAYIPLGILPNFAQWLIKLTPGAYVAALYRQILMGDQLNIAFHGQPKHFEKIMGIRLAWHYLLTRNQTIGFLVLIFLLGLLALLTIELVRSKKRVKTTL